MQANPGLKEDEESSVGEYVVDLEDVAGFPGEDLHDSEVVIEDNAGHCDNEDHVPNDNLVEDQRVFPSLLSKVFTLLTDSNRGSVQEGKNYTGCPRKNAFKIV